MTDTEIKVLKLVESLERFSPTLLSKFNKIDLITAFEICESLVSLYPERFKKWFRIKCPSCNSMAASGKFNILDEINVSNCPECFLRFHPQSDDIQIYYSNSDVRTESVNESSSGTVEHKFTSTNLSFIEEATTPGEFFKNKRSFIWHLSDFHFCGDSLSVGHGHSVKLLNIFKEVLKKRSKKIKEDIFVMSGDLTDSGSKKDFGKLNEFIKEIEILGVNLNNVILIPGNHDSWEGSSRLEMILGMLKLDRFLLRKAAFYEKRYYLEPLAHFNEHASFKISKTLNNRTIEFIGMNTCIRGEMARGIFPSGVVEPNIDKSLRIAVMHHHLIHPDSMDYEFGYSYLKSWFHKPTMRVINASVGLNYLFNNKFDLSLHGHKHTQYSKYENPLNSNGKSVLIVSSPSLCENSHDDIRGSSAKGNRIGFNIIIPEKNGVDLAFFDLRDWTYRISRHIEY